MTPPMWEELLRRPHPCDHMVQLYHDEAFLARAVLQFFAPGFAAGEAGLIIATAAHADLFTRRLQDAGVDVVKALDRTQLIIEDAARCLGEFMKNGRPDRQAFFSFVSGVLGRVRAAGFDQVRVFGEMVDLLWDRDLEATIELEALWNAVLADERVSLLCAYHIDVSPMATPSTSARTGSRRLLSSSGSSSTALVLSASTASTTSSTTRRSCPSRCRSRAPS